MAAMSESGIKMSAAMTHLILFLSLCSSAMAAGVPVYPGATRSAAMTDAMQEKHPGSAVYQTPDDFEKVCAFYRNTGMETPTGTLLTNDVKHAGFKFPGTTSGASISWRRSSAVPGTTIMTGTADR